MKCKVKGLVFVGFAAAILAGAAHAADENIVTSKAYTDATYEQFSRKELTKASLVTNKSSTTNYPSNAAITAYVDDAIAAAGAGENDSFERISNRAATIDNTMGSATTYPTTGAVVTYAQEKDGTDTYKVSKNGEWQAANTAIGVTGPITKVDNSNGSATIGVNTASGFANVETEAGQAGTEDGYLPTARAVKEYVDSQVTATANDHTYTADEVTVHKDANNQFSALTGTVANDAQTLTTGNQVYDYVQGQLTSGGANGNGYQEKSTATSVGVNGGTWKPLSATGYVAIDDTGSSVTVDIPASAINNSGTLASGLTSTTGTDLVTEYTLQQTMASQPASNIPAQSATVCTTNTPCALVAAADGYHWITMATGTHQGGVCGDAGGGTCGGMGTAPNA